jgi:ribosomal protein S18 acetylase RimI-like enzyme
MLVDQKNNSIIVELVKKPNKAQKEQIAKLQQEVFSHIDEKEIKEDFYHPESAHVLAYLDNELVAWAGVHTTQQIFQGKSIRLGGYGICVHCNYQGRGIGSLISKKAMEYLKNEGIEVAFLSVDLDKKASVAFHKKIGYKLLSRKFSWTNSKGELKEDYGGMIAPLNSQELFEFIKNGNDVLSVGNGCW